MRNAYRILVQKPQGKRLLLGGPMHRCEANMKLDIREEGCEDVVFI
jgi:hypothetical protein